MNQSKQKQRNGGIIILRTPGLSCVRVNIWSAAVELTSTFFLECSNFPAVFGLPSPAALIKTAAEPKAQGGHQLALSTNRTSARGSSYSLFCVYTQTKQ